MKVLIDDHIQDYSPEQIAQWLDELPEWRRQQALAFKHDAGQRQSLLAYRLLCQGLREEYGIVEPPTFQYGEHGKPYIEIDSEKREVRNEMRNEADSEKEQGARGKRNEIDSSILRSGLPLESSKNSQFSTFRSGLPLGSSKNFQLSTFNSPHFSLSHCREAVACAIADKPCGIDIESAGRKVSDSLIRYSMNEGEQAVIRESDDPQRTFLRLWTQKEALLKLKGTGIRDNMRDVLTDNAYTIEIRENERYILSVAW